MKKCIDSKYNEQLLALNKSICDKNRNYKGIRFFSKMILIIGWIASILFILRFFVQLSMGNVYAWDRLYEALLYVPIILSSVYLITGLLKVFLDIEENTRATAINSNFYGIKNEDM